MERAAGGGSSFFERVGGQDMSHLSDQARGGESFLDVVAFEVNIGIDLVGYAVVALVALEADVVSSGADPERLCIDLERSLPDAQVIAGGYDLDGFGTRPAVILRTAEKVQWAHRHGEIRFLGNAFEDAVKHGASHVGIHLDPSSRGENFLHRVFRAEDEEVDHVAGVAIFVRNAARKLDEDAGAHT